MGLTALDRLPLDDFEGRLRRVRAAVRAAPQLVEARYFRAELVGDALVGKGQWRVRHPGPGAAVLPLQPLTVALHQPRFETRDAVVAEFEGQGPGLLVEGEGEQTVNFDWSARREPGPEGVQFQLGLPQCPIASLELDLPANLLVATDGLPLTGPLPADRAELRRWRVVFSSRLPVSLTLRGRPEAGQTRVLLAGPLLTHQKLTPDAVEADFSFDHLKVQSGEFRELTFALDPSLRPYDVTAPELEGWDLRLPPAPGAPALLVVRLREALVSGSLVVRCVAPLEPAAPARWTAPWLRLLDAVPEGETLHVTVQPDVSLDAWKAGGFRLVKTDAEPEGLVLRLVGGLLAEEPGQPVATSRPSARLRARGTDFRARQVALWKVDLERSSFTSVITYEVQHGRLFRLALGLPPGYELEMVRTEIDGQIRNWETRSERGKPTLLVDLSQPLGPESKLQLLVRLRPVTVPAGGLIWPIPDLVPLGARLREGGLAIDFDEQRFEGRVTGGSHDQRRRRGRPAPGAATSRTITAPTEGSRCVAGWSCIRSPRGCGPAPPSACCLDRGAWSPKPRSGSRPTPARLNPWTCTSRPRWPGPGNGRPTQAAMAWPASRGFRPFRRQPASSCWRRGLPWGRQHCWRQQGRANGAG